MSYYGQTGEDSVLRQFFHDKLRGFYVDIGAHDGKRFSNTLILDVELEWCGICVEAHPGYYELLKKNRPHAINLGLACGDEDKPSCDFFANYRGALSSLDPRTDELFQGFGKYYAKNCIPEVEGMANGLIHVPMRTLDSVLAEFAGDTPIDVLSLDVDGSERWVLDGFRIDRWRPRVAVVEIAIVPDLVRGYMSEHGYHLAKEIGYNAMYCLDADDAKKLSQIHPKGSRYEMIHPLGWN